MSKHDGHDYDIDHEGKNTWRFSKVGYDMSIITSSTRHTFVAIVTGKEEIQENIPCFSFKDIEAITSLS